MSMMAPSGCMAFYRMKRVPSMDRYDTCINTDIYRYIFKNQ
jgi:hypothetical protein